MKCPRSEQRLFLCDCSTLAGARSRRLADPKLTRFVPKVHQRRVTLCPQHGECDCRELTLRVAHLKSECRGDVYRIEADASKCTQSLVELK
jgi:hypothetical protein